MLSGLSDLALGLRLFYPTHKRKSFDLGQGMKIGENLSLWQDFDIQFQQTN